MTINPNTIPTLPGEAWRAVPSEPELWVSSLGRVWRPSRSINGRLYPGGILMGSCEANGRRKVYVGRKRYRKVAALVCEAFHGPRPTPKHECLHLDEDCTNDAATNVRWGTKAENQSAPGLAALRSRIYRGERHPNARLSDDDVRAIRAAKGQRTMKALASEYGVTWKYIGQIWSRSTRTREAHHGD